MALRAKWQFMDRSVTHKIVYGPQLRFGPYNILWVTDRSINCHMALSAMNYLLIIIISENNLFIRKDNFIKHSPDFPSSLQD
jgi:hypothetical protein